MMLGLGLANGGYDGEHAVLAPTPTPPATATCAYRALQRISALCNRSALSAHPSCALCDPHVVPFPHSPSTPVFRHDNPGTQAHPHSPQAIYSQARNDI